VSKSLLFFEYINSYPMYQDIIYVFDRMEPVLGNIIYCSLL